MRGPRSTAPRRSPRHSHPSPPPPPDFSSTHRRDSDASSLCSNRPSPAFPIPSTPSLRSSLLRSINSYLSSLSPPLHLSPPLPSARQLSLSLRSLLSKLHLPHPLSDLTRDLPPLLAALKCPIKLTKSALKAPSTPHAFPSFLSLLHWLVQLAIVADHLTPPQTTSDHDINRYVARSYCLFLAGDDFSIAGLDAEYQDRLRRHAESAAKEVEAMEGEIGELERRVRGFDAAKSRLEEIEGERAALREDVGKFRNVVEKYKGMIGERMGSVGGRERELERREAEMRRLEEENGELRERVLGQKVSVGDAKRVMREVEAVEREVAEGERRRNEVEEKAWMLELELERRFREIGDLGELCNQGIRK